MDLCQNSALLVVKQWIQPSQRSTKPRFVGNPATCKVAKCSHSDCDSGQCIITSAFQTECEERRKSSATERFRPEWTIIFAFFLKFARLLAETCDFEGKIAWLDKRHWPASSRIQRKSCSFLISVSLRAKIPNFADFGGFRNLRGIPQNSG